MGNALFPVWPWWFSTRIDILLDSTSALQIMVLDSLTLVILLSMFYVSGLVNSRINSHENGQQKCRLYFQSRQLINNDKIGKSVRIFIKRAISHVSLGFSYAKFSGHLFLRNNLYQADNALLVTWHPKPQCTFTFAVHSVGTKSLATDW